MNASEHDILSTYVTSIFSSSSQLGSLRKALPDAIASGVYDYLEKVLDVEGHSSAVPDLGKVDPDRVNASVSQLAGLLSDRRQQLASSKPRVQPGVGDVPLLFGSVWSVKTTDEMKAHDWGITECLPLVVLAETIDPGAEQPEIVQIFPAPFWGSLAGNSDLLVADSPTAEPLLVQVWNEQPVLVGQLDRCLGALSLPNLKQLAELAAVTRSGRQLKRRTERTNDARHLRRQIDLLRTLPIRLPAIEHLARPPAMPKLVPMPFHFPAAMAMAADSSIESPQAPPVLRCESPKICLMLSESTVPGRAILTVQEDNDDCTIGADVIDGKGRVLATLHKRSVSFNAVGVEAVGLRLSNGTLLDLQME